MIPECFDFVFLKTDMGSRVSILSLLWHILHPYAIKAIQIHDLFRKNSRKLVMIIHGWGPYVGADQSPTYPRVLGFFTLRQTIVLFQSK